MILLKLAPLLLVISSCTKNQSSSPMASQDLSASLDQRADAEIITIHDQSGSKITSLYIQKDNLSMTILGIGHIQKPSQTQANDGYALEWKLNQKESYPSYGKVVRRANIRLYKKEKSCLIEFSLVKKSETRSFIDRTGSLQSPCPKRIINL